MGNIPPNEKSVMMTWNEPTGVSKSGTQTIEMYKTHRPMDGFPVGGTDVTYLFMAPDGSFNYCQFSIVISRGLGR